MELRSRRPADDLAIRALRWRQMRNFLAILSQGTPMVGAGDEFGRTQNGNNNAYCQDNEIGWRTGNWTQPRPQTPRSRWCMRQGNPSNGRRVPDSIFLSNPVEISELTLVQQAVG